MFDLRAIRQEPDVFRKGWERRKIEGDPVGEILKLDETRRSVQTKLQELQATRNAESAKIGKIKKALAALNRGTEEFASARMDKSIRSALAGQKIDQLEV